MWCMQRNSLKHRNFNVAVPLSVPRPFRSRRPSGSEGDLKDRGGFIGLILRILPVAWFCMFCLIGRVDAVPVVFKYNVKKPDIKIEGNNIGDKIYLPVHKICKLVNTHDEYSSLTNRIILVHNDRKITLYIDTNQYIVGESRIYDLPDSPKFVKRNLLMSGESLAIVLADLLGVEVLWKEKEKKLIVTDKDVYSSNYIVASIKKIKKIIIDAGHGGHDAGAVGDNGLREKDVNLDVALRLAELVEMKGIEVILTRKDDTFISLPDRVKIANKSGADMFISIHVNAGRSREARGTEVYIFNLVASSREAQELADRENIGIESDYLNLVLNDLKKRCDDNDSINVAGYILENMVQELGLIGRSNKKIMRAPFYVLAHTQMPAVLVEVAFISNSYEEQLLSTRNFRLRTADSILSGIKEYKNSIEKDKKKIEKNTEKKSEGFEIPEEMENTWKE